MEEENNEKSISPEDQLKSFNHHLSQIGLSSIIDYSFLEFAQFKSREMIKNFKNNLNFLFELVLGNDNDRTFPYATWLEKIKIRKFEIKEDPDEQIKEKYIYVVWLTKPSEKWLERNILSPGDFHLYFLDVVKPKDYESSYSAEGLYRVIDQKRGQTYFLNLNTREDAHQNGMIILLFITPNHIISFHIEKLVLNDDIESQGGISKWVDLENKIIQREVQEFAIFRLPEGNFVLTPEQAIEMERVETLDNIDESNECEMCGG